MSHFVVLIVASSESHVEALLEPYDENREDAAYQKPCKCGLYRLHNQAREHAEDVAGRIDELRSAFHKLCAEKGLVGIERDLKWKETIQQYVDAEKDYLEKHKEDITPRKSCTECRGTGVYTTTYNKDSNWDWYKIGGRWAGSLAAKKGTPDDRIFRGEKSLLIEDNPYIDEKHPDNPRCDGLQVEDIDWEVMDQDEEELRKRWKEYMKEPPIIQSVIGLLEEYKDEDGYVKAKKPWVPFAVLDEEGWKGRANMGWFGMDDGDPEATKKFDEWFLKYRDELTTKYAGKMVFIVDCHI